VTWSLAFPNLLVGLREGLEAGLVVTILIGAMRKLAPERPLRYVWLGVASAAAVSLSFGAVLTYSRAELSPRAQEIFGGVTSLVAVCLVTTMIFWMRRAARGMAGDLRAKVGTALAAGAPALVLTAFIAVAREGLETALFVWTNAQAAGTSTSPLLGALIGLLVAIALCFGLYRRVVKVNLAKFFTVTGAILVVIVGGVLAYGLGDLQDANVLPGLNNVAFDVSRHVPTGTWWTETLRGITNLNNRMSWLQVGAYLGYIAVVLTLFLYRRRSAAPEVAAAPADPTTTRPRSRRAVLTAGIATIALPAAVAGIWVAVAGGDSTHRQAQRITLTNTSCAADWAAPDGSNVVYSVRNAATHAVDVELVVSSSQAVVAEIEVLGPGTTRDLPATLGSGAYQWRCVYSGAATTYSASRQITAGPVPSAATPLKPTTPADLAPALKRYRAFVGGQLALLDRQVAALQHDAAAGNRAAAERSWLAAHLTYHRIGAAYDAFGAAGDAVDGLAEGLPKGTADADFVGFHRIERDLWSGARMTSITTETAALATAVNALHAKLPSFSFDPNDVTIRAHEILEDTLRFTLTGQDDYGSGSGFATAAADLAGDRALVTMLAGPLNQRSPGLVGRAYADMDVLDRALRAAGTTPVGKAGVSVRQRVNAATGQLLETLAPIPDLLEIRAQ